MTAYLSKAMAIVGKDILFEVRTKEVLSSVLVFALLVIFIFNFAFEPGSAAINEVAPGILWVAIAFAAVLSLGRAMVVEQDRGCLEGLMLAPVDRSAIYVGKTVASLIFVLIIEAVAYPVFAILFNLPLLVVGMAPIMVLGTIGLVVVGTLFSTIAASTKAREVLLPILFFPVVVPVVIAAVKATGLLIVGGDGSEMQSWVSLLVLFDVIFATVSFLCFEYILEQ